MYGMSITHSYAECRSLYCAEYIKLVTKCPHGGATLYGYVCTVTYTHTMSVYLICIQTRVTSSTSINIGHCSTLQNMNVVNVQ